MNDIIKMSSIEIECPSTRVLAKLRKGHRCRIKKGTGMTLIIHPDKMNHITRCFSANRGAEVELSPPEIMANQQVVGSGIFGKRFDKLLDKAGIRDLAYKIGDKFKPHAKRAITAGLTAGAAALATVAPEIAPALPFGVAGLSGLANEYLDNPASFGIHQRGSTKSQEPMRIPKPVEHFARQSALQAINHYTGQNLGNLDRDTVGNALANSAHAKLEEKIARARMNELPKQAFVTPSVHALGEPEGGRLSRATSIARRVKRWKRGAARGLGEETEEPEGGRLSRATSIARRVKRWKRGAARGLGEGLGEGLGFGLRKREVGSVGINGSVLGGGLSPAMVSQPYGANFQFSHTLPPAYQRFSRGN